ncbi:hypothetical protein [Chitinimonas sp. BJB300]|uniref:hypothetical protein n=1 Tax=Chitinimonas sp. BJB300 TaxID=1559339 RepID=UPI000C1050EE|nr:hypothetical protein [Chitinimonas sp. BJB300]PHV09903.1 hypothetical protein CSQ89_19080 [Chitinimonas sp. BJB300]TSJ90093.1 hypothetical protein FG002_007870 [Chitinimonas sp. BJB300]
MLTQLQTANVLAANTSVEIVDSLLLSYRQSITALANYQPGYWLGSMSVIHAQTTPLPSDPKLGWFCPLCAGGDLGRPYYHDHSTSRCNAGRPPRPGYRRLPVQRQRRDMIPSLHYPVI